MKKFKQMNPSVSILTSKPIISYLPDSVQFTHYRLQSPNACDSAKLYFSWRHMIYGHEFMPKVTWQRQPWQRRANTSKEFKVDVQRRRVFLYLCVWALMRNWVIDLGLLLQSSTHVLIGRSVLLRMFTDGHFRLCKDHKVSVMHIKGTPCILFCFYICRVLNENQTKCLQKFHSRKVWFWVRGL